MKRLILDGRDEFKTPDVEQTINALHDLHWSYCRIGTTFPNDKVTDDIIQYAMKYDVKSIKGSFAIVILDFGIEYFYWN